MTHDLARIRQRTTSWNVLSVIAIVFLVGSFAFWGVLHWASLVVPGAGIPQAIVAIVMTLVYALALPLLLSMLVPTTPAGMLLQKTQWRTFGFPVIIASALFLAWHARNLMLIWFSAQPVVGPDPVSGAPGQETAYTIACLIAFVVIPALAWVQATPEQWLAQIRQAHDVRKLEMEQRGELAIIKARLLWAEQRAALSYAKLLPAEQEQVRGTLRGLFMGIADTQRSIARTVGVQADVERAMGIPGDDEIAETLDYVERELAKPAVMIERAIGDNAPAIAPAPPCGTREAHQEATPVTPASPPHSPVSGPPPRPAATRRDPPRYAAEYATARERLSMTWSVTALAEALGRPERTARDRLTAWEADGLVGRGTGKGVFYFTEEAAQHERATAYWKGEV